jgi:hypothetical protein
MKPVEAHGKANIAASWTLRSPTGAAADDCHIGGRRVGETLPGDDSRAAGESDRVGGTRDRDRLDCPRTARPSRQRRSFRPRRSALQAEMGRFVTFAHSRLSQMRSRPCGAMAMRGCSRPFSPHARRAERPCSPRARRLRSSAPMSPSSPVVLEQVAAPVGGFDLVANGVRERHLTDLGREVRLLSAPIAER